MKKIHPFLWFNANAEEAMEFYTKLFPDSRIVKVTHLSDNVPPEGKALMGEFEIMGETFFALNGGENPMMQNTGPISLTVLCDTQEEIDRLWDAFKDGGKELACGWIQDKYGITWQVTPTALGAWMADPDPEKAKRTAACMMSMMKFDIAELQKAHDGA